MYKIRIPCLIVIMLCLVLTVGVSTGCEEARGNIIGRVLDENGKAVSNAIIRAERSGYPGILLRTDEDGHYSINNISTGKWDIEFYDEHGFPLGLEEVTVNGGKTSRVDFNIGDKPPPSNMPRLINVPQVTE
jgi:uncharacterized membrane protein